MKVVSFLGILAVLVLTGLTVAGCSKHEEPATGSAGDALPKASSSYDYDVVFSNALSDTLEGSAKFGRVLNPANGEEYFVIRLMTGIDFAGGVVIARRDTSMPQPGRYELTTVADTFETAPKDRFLIMYRAGMLRDLRSTSGTLTLSRVSDSLITGSFDATLEGFLAERDERFENAQVHAAGRFKADRGSVGYIIGL